MEEKILVRGVAGLLPYVYLPIRSAQHPPLEFVPAGILYLAEERPWAR